MLIVTFVIFFSNSGMHCTELEPSQYILLLKEIATLINELYFRFQE